MLTKMGWSEGKGLGKNEDGSLQHPPSVVKEDTLGLGATTHKHAAEETYQQLSLFDSILRRAAQEEASSTSGSDSALESTSKKDKSKKSKDKKRSIDRSDNKRRRRKSGEKEEKKKKSVSKSDSSSSNIIPMAGRLSHRQKFIKCKQVNQYSERHLREILGSL